MGDRSSGWPRTLGRIAVGALVAAVAMSCSPEPPRNAVRVRDGDWQYTLTSREVGMLVIVGQTAQPGQKTAAIEVVNVGAETASFRATIVIRNAKEDQVALIAGSARPGWSSTVFVPYDSRGDTPWRFGVKTSSGEILWLD